VRLRELLGHAVERFEHAGVDYGHGTTNAVDEAAWLILRALDLPPHDLNSHLDDRVDAAHRKKALDLVERRVRTRKPAAYLLREAWLGPHRFYVDERVIVPRSYIAELFRKWSRLRILPSSRIRTVLDLCTGSGCLAILAKLTFPAAKVDAADLSPDALAVARRNIADYGLEADIRLVESDLFSALGARRYDLIVSNPPYVNAAAMRRLPPEYRKEPRIALASGADGLDHTRAILAQAKRHLEPGGALVVEIGHNRKALEKNFPGVAFGWPPTSAGRNSVFTLSREALARLS
jgi:ribosomal protein L3 glutamine methyltransferase